MSRTSQRVDSRRLALAPVQAAASPVRDVSPHPAPNRVRRRRVSPKYWLFRIRISWRRRRLNGDAALLLLCFLLFAATLAAGVSVVVSAA
ncbi:MAG TPA: hypothetical protein VMZ00_00380 [Sporichthya sp.]|nr:hypothetical protein [Sporichthya sp.]